MNFSISWLFVLSKIALKASGARLLLNIMFSNLSQVFLVASLFLPLKALILMGSQAVPDYFPGLLQKYPKDTLLVIFCALAVFLYFSHILLDFAIVKNTMSLSKKIVDRKINAHVLESEHDFCAKIFERVSRALSAFCFVLLCLFASWVLSVYMLAMLIVVTGVVFIAFTPFSLSKKQNKILFDAGKFEARLQFFSPLAFFMFSFSLIFYLHDAFLKDFFLSVLAIFAARQFFQRVNLFLTEVFFIEKNHHKMSRMLSLKQKDMSIDYSSRSWAYLQRESFFSGLDDRFAGDKYKIEWVDTAPIGIPAFSLKFVGVGDGKNLLARFYDNLYTSVYEQERVLYLECGESGLFLDRLEEFRLGQGRLVIYEVDKFVFLGGERFENRADEIREALYSIVPSEGLLDIYRRSKGGLDFDALNETSLSKLEVGCNSDEDRVHIEALYASLHDVKSIVSSVPLFVFNKELSRDNVLVGPDGLFKFISWSGWQILPIGVDRPLSVMQDEDVANIIDRVSLFRSDLIGVGVTSFRMSNYAYNLLRALERDNCKTAVVFARRIVDLLKLYET